MQAVIAGAVLSPFVACGSEDARGVGANPVYGHSGTCPNVECNFGAGGNGGSAAAEAGDVKDGAEGATGDADAETSDGVIDGGGGLDGAVGANWHEPKSDPFTGHGCADLLVACETLSTPSATAECIRHQTRASARGERACSMVFRAYEAAKIFG